jgi:CheY-like chemotaxis protein
MSDVQPPPDSSSARRILLVEDHADTARALARLLAREGYHVSSADTVETGVERGVAEPFDLLVCDLELPDGDGRQVLHRIRQHRSIRGIVMSGYGMAEDVQASLEAGFIEHITKPVDFRNLTSVIARVMA